ncbi:MULTISPECIES: hypothetical protein [unclassified Flavobacterium]|uniref:hypothetical protein n=1 Tax=unclassified Flavobacterium TaxID=196869 RepID=UPI003F924346
MKQKYLNIVALVILTLLSCEKKYVINSNAFEYKWYSLDGNLTINSNNTFEFNRFTCISQSISKGKWKITNDTIVLNSFEPKGCYYIESFILEPPPPLKDTITNHNFNHKKTIKECTPNIGYVVFRNEKFYIKDSTLISKSFTYINIKELNGVYNFKKIKF